MMILNPILYNKKAKQERGVFLKNLSLKKGIKMLETLLSLGKFFKNANPRPLPIALDKLNMYNSSWTSGTKNIKEIPGYYAPGLSIEFKVGYEEQKNQ